MGFIPKQKDDEKKVFTPLTDQSFRNASLSPMTIEERRRWEVMFARFHQPHSEITAQFEGFTLPPGGEPGDFLATDGKDNYYWSHGTCYWLKAGANIYFATGNIAVGDVPNDTNTIYAKGNILVQSDLAQPYVKISNASATERDPVLQFAVGATPVVKWTEGLDDSDSDNRKWCNDTALGTTTTEDTSYYGASIIVADWTNNRIKKHSAADSLVYEAKLGSLGTGDSNFNNPYGLCSDKTHVYVCDYNNHRIKKHLLSDLSFVAETGSFGTGNAQFNGPWGICTDGVFLYINDQGNNRIKKHRCDDLSYVAHLDGADNDASIWFPAGICTDGTSVYVSQQPGGAYIRLAKLNCSDLAIVAHIHNDGNINNHVITTICTDGTYLYLLGSSTAAPDTYVFKYTTALAYDSSGVPAGTGNGQVSGAVGICTNGTHLYVCDTSNNRIQKFLCSNLSYVAKFGSAGTGDDQFQTPYGITIGFLGDLNTRTGQLLVLHRDGSFFDIYPRTRLYEDLLFMEDSVAAAKSISLKAPTAITASYILTLPAADSTGTQALHSNGSGTLSWITPAPVGAKYIVQEADATLTAEQSLGALATGILKNTTTVGVGVLSIATGADLPDHSILSATHGDSTAASVVLGDIISGQGASPNTKWVRTAGNTTAVKQYLSQTGTGAVSAVPVWAAIAQADVTGLTTGDSPVFVTVKLSGLTDDYIPYHVNDATGLANGPTKTNVDSAVSLKHAAVTLGDHADHLLTLAGQAIGTPVTDQKKFYAGPTSGAAAAAEFRTIAVADLPTVTVPYGGTGATTLADGGLVIGNAAGAVEVVAAGLTTQILVGGGALTAPVWGTDIPTAVTIGTAYIYRASGTDVPVADGGTGASTFALNGVLYGNAANAIGVTAIGAEGQFLRVGANPFVPAWSTLTLPNTGTAYRLPVFSATNVMTELAAVGATGEYLKGNTGAIPSWATLNQAAVAGLATTDCPTFQALVLSAPLADSSLTMISTKTTTQSWGYGVQRDNKYFFIIDNTAVTIPLTIEPAALGNSLYIRTLGRVGINNGTPVEALDVTGSINVTGSYKIANVALAQANIVGLTTADGPTFAHLHISDVAAITTSAESWVGPSSTAGIYFKSSGVSIGVAGSAYSEKLAVVGDISIHSGNSLILRAPANDWNMNLQVFGSAGSARLAVMDPATGEIVTILYTGNVGINDTAPAEKLDVNGNINVTGVYKVDDVQVVSNRVIDARCDDAINSGDATTDGVIDALRDAMIAHGLLAAS